MAGGPTTYRLSTARFRDVSAWYHIVLTWDTTQGTAADRVRLYVNGTQLTAFDSSTDPSQNFDGGINRAKQHNFGFEDYSSGVNFLDAYLAECHFIDGSAKVPGDFAETDATTGQWIPKLYSGSYGTNGFKLTFADNSAATATTLGKDSAGSNNWTPNNFSVTAGAGNDSLTDTPTSYGTGTSGGDVRGNFCVWNPLDSESGCTFANGNLEVSTNGGRVAVASFGVPTSGKWYWEGTFLGAGGTDGWIGAIPTINRGDGSGRYYRTNGQQLSGGSWTAYGASYGQNDVIGVALDQDNNTVTFYKNGTSQGAQTSVPLRDRLAACNNDGSAGWAFNFGQRAFAYPVSGFKALVDTNLTAPVVAKPNTVMDVKLYTGNGGTQSITGLGFNPDLVWLKIRNTAGSHGLWDAIRGTGARLDSGSTGAEDSTVGVTAFNSDGFTVGGPYNSSSNTWVAWAWDAGSSTVTNTQGSITSSVRANASAGFSIVTYTGNATAGATVGHGLGVSPSLCIFKRRNLTSNWLVLGSMLGANQYLWLETTNAAGSDTNIFNANSSTITLQNFTNYNANGGTYVAYCFAPVTGYSSFGSYTGNGSADGPFVYTGFRPRWILTKETTAANVWTINDTARDPYNAAKSNLWANQSSAEDTSTSGMDILSNGFKPRTSANYNNSGQTYIFAAFAENPFQYARAR